MKSKLFVIAAATTFAGATFAAEPGFYIGADVGATQQNIDSATPNSTHPTVGGVYGGYNFDKHFGIEANYYNLGKAKVDGQSEVKTQLGGVDLVGRYPATDKLDLYGKFGVAYVDRQIDFAAGGDESKSGMAGKLGIGAEYAVAKNIGVRAEVAHYMGAPKFEGPGYEYKDNFTTFTVGANYRF
jgi:OOP family OmpA-OmpF porin